MGGESTRALTVEEALARVLADVTVIADVESVPLLEAAGRVLAEPPAARHNQPPFDASAMDGYAVRSADVVRLPATLEVIGEAAAGHGFAGAVGSGEAVRIFTGAPMPQGADAIVIQENTERRENRVIVLEGRPDGEHIRPCGGDFRAGDTPLMAGQTLAARHLLLAASMGHTKLSARRKPRVAIIATGDELVLPGEMPGPDQIVCSNPIGVAAMLRTWGAEIEFLGIARDTKASLDELIGRACGADILITLGGASVGDHDLVGPTLAERGMALDFWKIAMRPGKPLMFGRLGTQRVLGLPGNPVSSMITARLFVVPLVSTLLGSSNWAAGALHMMPVAEDLPANGPRAHYMRAIRQRTAGQSDGVVPMPNQDSSLVTPLAAADALIVRPIRAEAVKQGMPVPVILLDF